LETGQPTEASVITIKAMHGQMGDTFPTYFPQILYFTQKVHFATHTY